MYIHFTSSVCCDFVCSSYPVLGCSSVFWVPFCVVLFFRLLFLGGMSYCFCGLLSSSPVWVRLVHFIMAFCVLRVTRFILCTGFIFLGLTVSLVDVFRLSVDVAFLLLLLFLLGVTINSRNRT
jgi:hypothetical protein